MIDFLTQIVPGILVLSIAISSYRKNKMAMPLSIFLITYVGFII